jgi:hypothetical protein
LQSVKPYTSFIRIGDKTKRKMIPIKQTKVVVINKEGTEVQTGNCYPAAIASLLEVPITEVPNFEVFYQFGEENTFYAEIKNKFLYWKGFRLARSHKFNVFHDPNYGLSEGLRADWLSELNGVYYIATGPSARGVTHCCIYQNGRMVHDPHPSNDGLNSIEQFEYLLPTTP